MNRHPWRTRARLLALINAIAGVATALGAVAVVVGVTGDIDTWTSMVAAGVAAAIDFVTFLANLGIVRDGEAETTPIDSPQGADRVPLVSARMIEDLQKAIVAGDLAEARAALGVEPAAEPF